MRLIGVGLCAALIPIYALLEPYWFQIKHVTLSDTDIPPAFDGLRIVFLTDIHHGPNFPQWRVRWLVNTVNALHPDLVLLGGDYYQWGRDLIQPCFEELRWIHAPLGKFGVLGNHDHFEDYAMLARQGMANAGIVDLDNRAVWIKRQGQRIKVGGIGDLQEDTQDLTPTLAETHERDFVMLISHNPEYAQQIRTQNIDMVLSGHTHGGQITLFGLWAPFMKLQHGQKYLKGMVETPFTKVIISNGLGMVSLPLRFCARPDLVVLTLRSGDQIADLKVGGN